MARPGQRIDPARFSTGWELADFSPWILALSPGQIRKNPLLKRDFSVFPNFRSPYDYGLNFS